MQRHTTAMDLSSCRSGDDLRRAARESLLTTSRYAGGGLNKCQALAADEGASGSYGSDVRAAEALIVSRDKL